MDGVGGVTSIEREHLCGTTCRSQQDEFLLQSCQSLDDGSGEGGLTRTSRTTEDHHHLFRTVSHKLREHVDGLFLFRRWRQSQSLTDAVFEFVLYHFDCKDSIFSNTEIQRH